MRAARLFRRPLSKFQNAAAGSQNAGSRILTVRGQIVSLGIPNIGSSSLRGFVARIGSIYPFPLVLILKSMAIVPSSSRVTSRRHARRVTSEYHRILHRLQAAGTAAEAAAIAKELQQIGGVRVYQVCRMRPLATPPLAPAHGHRRATGCLRTEHVAPFDQPLGAPPAPRARSRAKLPRGARARDWRDQHAAPIDPGPAGASHRPALEPPQH